MGQKAEQEHFSRVEVYGANEPIGVAANVEHHDRIAAGHAHLVRRTKAPAQVGKMPELLLPHDPPPDFQTRCGLRMSGGKSGQRAFLNNPHAYNLCSSANFVKHEKHTKAAAYLPPVKLTERGATHPAARSAAAWGGSLEDGLCPGGIGRKTRSRRSWLKRSQADSPH